MPGFSALGDKFQKPSPTLEKEVRAGEASRSRHNDLEIGYAVAVLIGLQPGIRAFDLIPKLTRLLRECGLVRF